MGSVGEGVDGECGEGVVLREKRDEREGWKWWRGRRKWKCKGEIGWKQKEEERGVEEDDEKEDKKNQEAKARTRRKTGGREEEERPALTRRPTSETFPSSPPTTSRPCVYLSNISSRGGGG